MMVDLNQFLEIMLYVVLIILIVIFIVLGIKLIRTLGKVDKVIEDVNGKMTKVDGIFNIIDKTTDYASTISDKIISGISNFISVLVRKKKGNDDNE